MDIEKERVAFEKNQFTYGYEYINDGICEHGRYKIKRPLSLDDSKSEFVTSAWYVWLERAKLAHQETQALQEALKEKLKDGVIVPREIPHMMDLSICDAVDYKIDVFEAERAYKAMIEAVEKDNE